MDFKAFSNSSRPIHMWAWNDKLNTNITAQHIESIAQSGFGGFCINAQSGLSTRYMGDEWFRNISVAISKASEKNLEVWISDENGFPSGTANGAVNFAGIEFQQKFLRCEAGEKSNDRTIISKDGYHFYYDTNPYYADILHNDAVELFISEAYLPYAEKFPQGITGFVSTFPSLADNCYPWSFSLPALYKDAYGEELLDVLTELFRPVGNYKETRIKYWSLITEVLSKNFFSKIYNWCSKNNLKYTVISASGTPFDFTRYGNIESQYCYTDFPSINVKSKVGSSAYSSIFASSLSSQFKNQGANALLLTNSGNSTTFEDLKREALLQFSRGVTKLSLGYGSYSLNGTRKRTNSTYALLTNGTDNGFNNFNRYISIISEALSSGKADFDTILIDNTADLWSCYDSVANDGIQGVYNTLNDSIAILEHKHIPFHITSEITLKKFAKVEDGCLCLGTQRYKNIVLSHNTNLLNETTELLTQLEHSGAFITVAEALAPNDVCDNENLLYTRRKFSDFTLHYFFNNSNEQFSAELNSGTKSIDPYTGDIVPFYGVHSFLPYDCLLLIEDDTPELPRPFKKPLKAIDLSGDWFIEESSHNVIVLDKCDVYINGNLTCENENAIDVTELLCAYKEAVSVECKFSFNVDTVPEHLFMSYNTPDKFSFSVNGMPIDETFDNEYLYGTFSGANITKYVTEGLNTVSVFANVSLKEDFLNSREKAFDSLSELSRLTYGIEFEPIFIVGDFSVDTSGSFFKLDKNAYRYAGDFSITNKRETATLSNLDKQGFPFFAGHITFRKTINFSDTQYCIRFVPKGINVTEIEINGQKVTPLLWAPYEADVSEFIVKGDNEIKLTVHTPLRNLLGPHHVPIGELVEVNAGDYYTQGCVWNNNCAPPWDNNYCFLEFGIDLLE